MLLKRICARILLALLLVLTQQALIAHPFSHLASGQSRDTPAGPPDSQTCLLCLASLHGSDVLAHAGVQVCAAAPIYIQPVHRNWTYLPASRPAFFLARAPPASL